MSVINTMLKDLDKRQQSHDLNELPVPPLQYQGRQPHRLPWVLLVVFASLLLIGGGLGWTQLSQLRHDNALLSQQVEDAHTDKATDTPISVQTDRSSVEPARGGAKSAQMTTKLAGDKTIEQNRSQPRQQSNVQSDNVQDKPKNPATPDEVPVQITAETVTLTEKPTVSAVKQAPKKVDRTTQSTSLSGKMAVTEVRLTPKQLAEKRFTLGMAAQNEGRQSEALGYFSEALRLSPQMHKSRQHLAALYYGQGMFIEAQSILEQGLSLFPLELDYALLLARVREAGGDKASALTALALIPDSHLLAKDKWTMQSQLAQQLGQYELAEASYRQLARLEPSQGRWWMGLGYALDSQQRYVMANQAYKQALKQSGLSNEAISYVESRLAQLGEFE
ncbi:tetratricopeptide repeat protein [Shewanella colwelliana]|uniref:tetratricopeptide repeat protein n=1 Tax=Shewanella colwelliana TaxID=23 RepID=UPI003CFC688B